MQDFTGTNLVRRGSAEEIVGHRNRALELYEIGLGMIAKAWDAHQLAAPGALWPEAFRRDFRLDFDEGRGILAALRKEVDTDVWRYLIEATGIKNIADATELKTMREQVDKDPAEVSIDNLLATFARLREDQDAMFRRGVVALFKQLDRSYKNNDAFRLNRKIILHYYFGVLTGRDGPWIHGGHGYKADALRDLDRIFHILDSKAPRDHTGDAAAMVRKACSDHQWMIETDYFAFNIYMNGNLHVRFKRQDIVARANQVVADHYGAQLGHGNIAGKPAKREMTK